MNMMRNCGIVMLMLAMGFASSVASGANLILPTNNSFEADTYTVFPGYISGNGGMLTGWTASDNARAGINDGSINPFANNGVIPDGSQVGFLQSHGTATTLSQNITGLTAGNHYVLYYRENSRSGYATPNVSVDLGGSTIVAAHAAAPVGGTNPYAKVVSSSYTAAGVSANLVYQNSTVGDSTVTLDDVRLYEYAADEAVVINNSFEWDTFASAVGYSSNGSNGPITGWTSSNLSRTGINPTTAPSSDFADNGAIPDGSQVAFIQASGGTASLSTTLNGLTVGQTYRVDLQLNSRGTSGTISAPLAKVAIDSQTLLDNQTITAVGGANPYRNASFYFTATAATQTLSIANVKTTGDSTILLDNVHVTATEPAWKSSAWNDDASSGVATGGLYSHAYNLGGSGQAPDTIINGVRFRSSQGPSPSNTGAQLGGDFTLAGYVSTFGADTNNITTGGSDGLANSFTYGGNPGTLTITGLLPGSHNVLTLYGVGFDAVPGRAATFTDTATGQRITVDENALGQDNGVKITYTYIADGTGTAVLDIAPLNTGNSFHLYGFANRVASTSPITGLFNTGVDSAGLALGDNAVDPHWTLDGSNAIVATSSGGFPIGPWLGDSTASAWITPANDTEAAPGSYTYQTTFNLENALAVIEGRFAVDNSVTAIILNGVTMLTNPGSGFAGWTQFTLDAGFVAGLNTLQFLVTNDSPTGPSGLRVEFTNAMVAAVPTPAALPAGLALMTLIGLRRRRR